MNKLTENHFSFKCPMNWDEMEHSANGRFCSRCRKEVFDLTNCSIDDVIALQRKHGTICGAIRVATVAASLTAAACTAKAPCPPEKTPDEPSHSRMLPGTLPAMGKVKVGKTE